MELIAGTIYWLMIQEIVLSVGRDMLSMLGYTALMAKRGPESVAVFEQTRHSVDPAALDIVLPGMSGPRFSRESRHFAQMSACWYPEGATRTVSS